MTALFVIAVELYKVLIRSRPWFENLGRRKGLTTQTGPKSASGAGPGEDTREEISKV
jgi:hypothetical protein